MVPCWKKRDIEESELIASVKKSFRGLFKYTLMFTVVGAIFTIVGATLQFIHVSDLSFFTVGYLDLSIVLIVLGIVNFITAAVGFAVIHSMKNAERDNTSVVQLFTVLLIVLQQFLLGGGLASVFLNRADTTR